MIPVILSGGSGTRLWPVSREAYPKPFIRLGGGPSLLQRTLARAAPLAGPAGLIIVTNEAYAFKTRDECEELAAQIKCPVHQILEPVGRNTAPAIALATLQAAAAGDDPVLLVLPADALVPEDEKFRQAALEAAALAAEGRIVLFGIPPSAPETGFGYIEAGDPLPHGGYAVRRFVEKPQAARALEFLAAGSFYWNSGMFCFRASTMLSALQRFAPALLDAAQQVYGAARRANEATPGAVVNGGTECRFTADAFLALPDISIDYAVMERAEGIALLRAEFRWSDIGSWRAVAEQLVPDADGNTSVGETMMVGSRNTHVQSDDRLVAAVGLDNVLVIDTPDALLVASKDASQQVREVVARLKEQGHEAARLHRTVARPWGSYTVLHESTRFKIKRIVVKPKHTLSLQMHHHRSEHWVVVSGTAKVSCDDRVSLVYANESTFIPIGARHRLENPGRVDLVMIEVQCGDYVGEDDIVRFDDRYGRVPAADGAAPG